MEGIQCQLLHSHHTTCSSSATSSASKTALPVAVAAGGYFTLSLLRPGMAEAYFTPTGILMVVT